MALWQITFYVLPKPEIGSDGKLQISEDGSFDDSEVWEDAQVQPELFDEISNFLERGKSWAKYITLFGSENSNRFEVYKENGLVESVSFRIDFTSDYEFVLRQILEFCLMKSFIILDTNLNVVPLNYEDAKAVIEQSPNVNRYNELL